MGKLVRHLYLKLFKFYGFNAEDIFSMFALARYLYNSSAGASVMEIMMKP